MSGHFKSLCTRCDAVVAQCRCPAPAGVEKMVFRTDLCERCDELRPDEAGFVECDTCRARRGSPTLCEGCVSNRARIHELWNMWEKIKSPTITIRGKRHGQEQS